MFYEYAVDPECYADAEQIKRLAGEFGWCEGRLISNFPATWLRKVKEAQDSNFRQLTIRQKNILTEEWGWLRKHKDKVLIYSGRKYDGNLDWISNALQQQHLEHQNKSFQAIIAHENKFQNAYLLLPENLNAREVKWKVRYDDRIPRTPEALCKCVEKLIQASSYIRFVDPYFNPIKKEWLNTLSAFINFIHSLKTEYHIEYHLRIRDEIKNNIDRIKSGNYNLKEEKWYQKFSKNCQGYIKPILLSQKIKLFLWCEIDPYNDWFHDRYILTEKGGVRFEGLDEGENPGQRTNVFRLSEELWKDRWTSLDKENSKEYKLLDTIDVPDLTSL